MKTRISRHCASLPQPLAEHLEKEFIKVQTHFFLEEWDDLQVDGGRFCEAILRYLEWKMSGIHTPIDGKSKPDRKTTANKARNDTNLPPSLRLQVIDATELVMDFRNNRNSAHLGDIDPNKIDGMTAYQLIVWVIGEVVRLESNLKPDEIQAVLAALAERPAPIIYRVDGQPVVLSTKLSAKEVVAVLLYDSTEPVPIRSLFKWSQHSNITRWRTGVLKPLIAAKMVFLNKETVQLLPPGMRFAEAIIKSHSESART